MLHILFVLVAESVPLFNFALVLVEFWSEGERYAAWWQIRAALFEGRADSLGQRFPIKFKSVGKAVQVVKVLHAGVRNAELYRSFELFRDYCFTRVSEQMRTREIQ